MGMLQICRLGPGGVEKGDFVALAETDARGFKIEIEFPIVVAVLSDSFKIKELVGVALKTGAKDDFIVVATSRYYPDSKIQNLANAVLSCKDKLSPRDMNSLLDSLSVILDQRRW